MLAELFRLNRPIVLFVYGLTFFVMGLAIFLQSRRYSRLRLARDLRWLAGFGLLHGLHEWGVLFIPIQSQYLPRAYIDLLISLQAILLAASFACLLMFGAATLEARWGRLHQAALGAIVVWVASFWVTLYVFPDIVDWHLASNVWARYLLGLPGSVLSAFGLHRLARETVAPLGADHIYRTLRVAGAALLGYGVVGGLLVPAAPFFPANGLNKELLETLTNVPIEVFRSLTGLVLAVAVIRALEIFEIELDQLINKLEIDQIQSAERSRIGQEIHDGALQGVYSTNLLLQTLTPMLNGNVPALGRLQQAQVVLNQVNDDLRAYMGTLKVSSTAVSLANGLRELVQEPGYRGLIEIALDCPDDAERRPEQVRAMLAIARESLANVVRHAGARRVSVVVGRADLTISDDGVGFAVDEAAAGWGLRAMRERALLAGGQIDITSTPGHGTRVRYTAPPERP